jgi:hypothetical protein
VAGWHVYCGETESGKAILFGKVEPGTLDWCAHAGSDTVGGGDSITAAGTQFEDTRLGEAVHTGGLVTEF